MERLYLKPSLCKAIEEYCKLNEIEDINNFANRCATQGFNMLKYGVSPADNINRENNGIKDFKKNEKSNRKKKDIGTENEGEQKEQTEPIRKQGPEASEVIEKKPIVVRKIQVIKKK